MRHCLRVCFAAALVFASAARAQYVDPSLRWRTLDTEHFSIHFSDTHRAQAETVAGVAEAVYPKLTSWLNWQPESRTHLVLLDSADFSDGYASPLPFNNFTIFLSPPDQGELLQNRAWLELVITHELTHIVHLDKAKNAPLTLRRIFGRFPLLFPNALQPDWIIEGLAVYSESDPAKGYGRLEQSQFEGMMRAERARGLRSLREVNAEGRGFPLNRDYLYGSYFFAFLAERYGAKAITDYVENYSDNVIPFRVQSNPEAVTGKKMDELWDEYDAWLRARFAPAAEARAEPERIGQEILHDWSVTAPVLAPDGTRWFVEQDGYTRPRLMRQRPGGPVEALREVEIDARLSLGTDGRPLLAQPEICGNYNYYYDLYRMGSLWGWNRLTHCSRFRFTAPLEDGRIVALRVANGAGEVVLLNADGDEMRTLYRAAPGEMFTGLAARGQSVIVTVWRNGKWALLEIGGEGPRVLLADDAVKHSPRFGASDDEIYFVAGYDKVYNVWSWRRDTRSLARWTQAPFGVSEISAPVGGEILLTTIEADGVILRRHRLPDAPFERRAPAPVAANPEAPEAAPPAPPALNLGPDRTYWPFSSMLPRSWFPAAQIGDGEVALGFTTFGQDALGLHQYSLSPLFEFTQHEVLGNAWYTYDNRHGVFLNRIMNVEQSHQDTNDGRKIDVYDIQETAQAIATWRDIKILRSFYWGLGAATDRERLHNVVSVQNQTVHDDRVIGLVAGMDSRRQQWLSEGPSQGQLLQLYAESSNNLGGDYDGNVYRSDWRVFFPAGTTVLSLRWNAVYSQADAKPIELGGVWSEETYGYTLPVLDQRRFPLRGYRLGEPTLTGRHAQLGSMEWRVPLSDVDRNLMVPPVGLNRVSMNLFADAGAAWNDAQQAQLHRGVGAELLTEVRIGYLESIQVRFGIARGIDDRGVTVGYLKVGREF
jgi:hypothetical protein